MATPREYVEAPPVTPLPFGLFSAATVPPDDGGHWPMGGVRYEPAYCGVAHETLAACLDATDRGSLSVSVDSSSTATLDVAGNPAGSYTIDWGDGSDPVVDTTPDAATHDYAADGVYQVRVTGPSDYSALALVTVTDGQTTSAVDATFTKVAQDGITVVEGDPFALYHLFKCRAPGSIDRGMDRAREALRLGEQRGAEVAFARQLPLMDGAVDLTPTPGTAVHPVLGLALLEGYSAANYGGVPTLHLPRSIGTIVATLGATERVGTHLETKQGSLIASGGGYQGNMNGPATDPDDPATVVAPGAGETWLYVTGQVVVRRGATIEVQPTPQLTNSSNEFVALAERAYVITAECIVAAVLVTTGYDVPDGAAVIDGGGA